ncbi:MAG TPA: putative lipid II flippase FtsW [Clostridiales bacterium]|jgi:cell division protein FtsW|nr:putative lipid II flippase FtsW [Clostridiales bacterium]
MKAITNNDRPSLKELLKQKPQGKIDKVLLIFSIIITLFGILMVYSASSYTAYVRYEDSFFYLKKQVLGAVLGLGAMMGLTYCNYKILDKLKLPILIISIILLIVVFIPGVGLENYGANRWIDLPGFTIQPSEIAKFAFIIFAAGYMAKNQDKMSTFMGVLPVLAVGGFIALLIILEPNMSITVCVILLMLFMLFLGGTRIKHFVILALPVAALVPILILIEPYRMNRLAAFLNPWASPLEEGFQLIQSYYSLGSGGLFGVGLFKSRQKYLFLPFSESDFIFSIIGEELGLAGSLLTIAVFCIIIYRCVRVALNAPDRLGCYMAAGVGAIIAIQVAVNIAVVTGSIPPTGLPLPFVSAGSSSLVVFMGGIGIVQNISRHSNILLS